jgi:hypothetical protein
MMNVQSHPIPSRKPLASLEPEPTNFSRRIAWIVLGLLIAVQLLPVWWFRFLPTQDGPAHVANAVLLRDLVRGEDTIHAVNPKPVPNWTGHALLSVFSGVVTPRVAEKFLVSLYVVLLPLCAAYAGRSVRRGGEWVGILAVPFVYSLALHKGLYNFCLSLAGFFLLIGLVIRWWEELNWGRVLLIGLVALLVYFSHVVSLILALITLGGLAIGALIDARQDAGGIRRAFGKLAMLAVAMAPAVALAAWFFFNSPGGASDRRPVGVQLLRIFELDALASFRKPELLVAIAFSALLWGMAICLLVMKTIKHQWSGWDWVLGLVAITLAVYLVSPNSAAGGGQISFRLSLYPYFVLMLWMAGQRVGWLFRTGATTAAAMICIVFLVLHWGSYSRLNVYLKAYESIANHMETGKSVIALDQSRDSVAERKFSWRVRPFWHAMGYVAAKRGVVDLGNYEVMMGYFPVVSRGTATIASSSDQTDDPSAAQERDALARKADYVVIWDLAGSGTLKDPQAAETLQSRYEVVYRSPNRWAKVYRKKAG